MNDRPLILEIRERFGNLRTALEAERVRHRATRHVLTLYLHELAQATGRETKALVKEAESRRIEEEKRLGLLDLL